MTYGSEDVSRDLTLILEGTADFETRARLEHHLLMVVQSDGLDGLAGVLANLQDHRFVISEVGEGADSIRLVSSSSESKDLVVVATLDEHVSTLDVSLIQEEPTAEPPYARHRAFYEIWESLLGTSDAEVAQLDPTRRAVFLIGILESEMMNGGLGQYLANTEGMWVDETLEMLGRVGASGTRAALSRAAALGAEHQSYLAAWDARSTDFSALDAEVKRVGEDLAGLTANALLGVR